MKKIEIILVILVAIGGCGAYLMYRALTDVEVGEHQRSVPWLPREASDICYYRSYLNTAYEFDISEEGFRRWADRWELLEITEPVEIARYGLFVDDTRPPFVPEYGTEEEVAEAARKLLAWKNARHARVTRGYFYAYKQSNGGGVWVVYDTGTGRAYYNSSPR